MVSSSIKVGMLRRSESEESVLQRGKEMPHEPGPASRRVGSVPGTCSRYAQIVDDFHSQAFIAAKVRIVEADLKTRQCKIMQRIVSGTLRCSTGRNLGLPLLSVPDTIS